MGHGMKAAAVAREGNTAPAPCQDRVGEEVSGNPRVFPPNFRKQSPASARRSDYRCFRLPRGGGRVGLGRTRLPARHPRVAMEACASIPRTPMRSGFCLSASMEGRSAVLRLAEAACFVKWRRNAIGRPGELRRRLNSLDSIDLRLHLKSTFACMRRKMCRILCDPSFSE
jgi:hypothetical protein